MQVKNEEHPESETMDVKDRDEQLDHDVVAEKHSAPTQGDVRVPVELITLVAANVDDYMNLVQEANEANERERKMPMWEALKLYRKAVMWSLILSTCLVMEGYDTNVTGSYTAYPSFTSKFGILAPNGSHQISASWQNGISGARTCGEIVGLQIAGFFVERVGHRWVLLCGLISLTGFIFIPFFANTLAVFLVGQLLQGIAWGIFQTMTVAYAVEVCPVPLRHILSAYVNLCWIMGQFVSGGALVAFQDRKDEWGYKIPFALQWIWPLPLITGIALAPESPWWHVRHGRKDRAEHSIRRLARKGGLTQREIDANIALMVYTNEMEKQLSEGTSYWDCFKSTDLRRTEIVCMIWMSQCICRVINGPYFFQQAGISADASFKLGWASSAINFCGTVLSWFIMNKVGRRQLMLWGMLSMSVTQLIAGFCGIPTPMTKAESWAAGGVLLASNFFFDMSLGPVVYVLVSEIPSSRLRGKSIVLARNAYNIIGVSFTSVVSFRQLSPAEWNWGPKAALFWGGICLLLLVWMYFRVPETKGRTFLELDILFENKVPARAFRKTVIGSLAETDAETTI